MDDAILDGADHEATILEVDLDMLPQGSVKTYLELANEGVLLDVRGHGEKLFSMLHIPASALTHWQPAPTPFVR